MIAALMLTALSMSDLAWSDKFVSGGGDVVTLAEVKKNIQVEITGDDTDVLDRMIIRATAFVENYTNRQLIDAARIVYLDQWPSVIELPRSPASAVASVKYIDGNGNQQPLAASKYQTDFNSEPARIKPAFGEVWPGIRLGDFNAIEIAYTAGYGAAAADTPQEIADACFLLIKDWYDMPGATTDRKRIEVPFGVYALLDAHRVPVPA